MSWWVNTCSRRWRPGVCSSSENLDGNGKQWKKHLVHRGDEHHQGAHVADLDRDGDLDIVSIGWTHNKVLLYENKSIGERPMIGVWYGDEQKFGRTGNPLLLVAHHAGVTFGNVQVTPVRVRSADRGGKADAVTGYK
jgi:hypothetical protein